MKKLLVAACAATAMFAPMTASAGDVSGSASLDYVTDYVFRGVSFAGAALQPGIELAVGDAYVGVWGSTPLGTASACLLYTSPSPRDQRGSRMPSSA